MSNERIECPEAAMDEYREELYSYISDASKDATGCRMRYDITQYTNAELEDIADMWSDRVAEAIAEEREAEVRHQAEFEKLVQSTIESGAGDRETAIRWLKDAEDKDDMMYDSWFNYSYGLGYNFDPATGQNKTY